MGFKDDLTRFMAKFGLDGRAETAGGQSVRVYMRDAAGFILFATGTTIPTATSAGFAKGCIFIDTDVAGGTGGTYLNKGTTSSCSFTLVTQG